MTKFSEVDKAPTAKINAYRSPNPDPQLEKMSDTVSTPYSKLKSERLMKPTQSSRAESVVPSPPRSPRATAGTPLASGDSTLRGTKAWFNHPYPDLTKVPVRWEELPDPKKTLKGHSETLEDHQSWISDNMLRLKSSPFRQRRPLGTASGSRLPANSHTGPKCGLTPRGHTTSQITTPHGVKRARS